jgi:isopenicillin N synthase-like dioxygenase
VEVSKYPDAETEDLVNRLIQQMSNLADTFLGLVGECLGLPTDTFAPFRGNMDRLKFIKYPPSAPESQGVGPHKDSTGLFTFLTQDTVGGLQVLNRAGQWIDALPIPDSLVVNIAQGFEAITGGLCPATTHRVVVSVVYLGMLKSWNADRACSQAPTETVRYSIPYFLAVRYDLTLDQLKESAANISERVPKSNAPTNNVNQIASEFLSPVFSCVCHAILQSARLALVHILTLR